MFWELLAGAALIGTIIGAVQLNLSVVLTGAAVLALCVWHWSRYP